MFFVKQLGIRFLDEGLHRVLFNAMPMPVFVVDEDVRILEYNAAAARLLGSDKRAVLQRRGGAVLHCLHATESLEGCGQAPACFPLPGAGVGACGRTWPARATPIGAIGTGQ